MPHSRAPFQNEDRVLLVIAHPDDEAMFFSPLLLWLAACGSTAGVLCLSRGNAYNQGRRREKELVSACAQLGVKASDVHVVEHPALQDGTDVVWPEQVVSREVGRICKQFQPNKIVTFDEKGVSGHINHVSTHRGVRAYLRSSIHSASQPIEAWQLETTGLFRKYIGAMDVPVSWLLAQLRCPNPGVALVVNQTPWRSIWAMVQHRSQLVWYRWLFVLFSRYTYVNTLIHLS